MKSTKCVNFGQILMGENYELFILCNICKSDVGGDVKGFLEHLDSCINISRIKAERTQMKYNKLKGTHVLGKTTVNDVKEFLVYDYADVDFLQTGNDFIDLLDIEEELLNPKWYTTENNGVPKANKTSQKQYEVLVEEVTPFVQFKEPPIKNGAKKVKFQVDSKCPTRTCTKRRFSDGNIVNGRVHELEGKYNVNFTPATNKTGENFSTCKGGADLSKVLPTKDICSAKEIISKPVVKNHDEPKTPAKEKKTAEILNKLSSLGLQIKRTNTKATTPDLSDEIVTDEKTLQILKKLQSKGGMKVKLINKQRQIKNISCPSVPVTNTNHLVNESIKPNIKNLIIRKVK